jgi:hypothetical protein
MFDPVADIVELSVELKSIPSPAECPFFNLYKLVAVVRRLACRPPGRSVKRIDLCLFRAFKGPAS